MKTFNLKAEQVERKWILIDAAEAPLGRVANTAAKYLIGKYKPTYTPHIDDGDFVVVINAGKLITTGDKDVKKVYYSYSGYPSGLKEKTLGDLKESNPSEIIRSAVKGMLPKNKLSTDRLARLKVFADDNHAHAAQKPVKVEVGK